VRPTLKGRGYIGENLEGRGYMPRLTGYSTILSYDSVPLRDCLMGVNELELV